MGDPEGASWKRQHLIWGVILIKIDWRKGISPERKSMRKSTEPGNAWGVYEE